MRALRLGLLPLLAALAGCGGGGDAKPPPQLPAPLARSLAAQADGVAQLLDAGDGCGARGRALALQQAVIGAINEHRVPAPYQEPLLGDVNLLLDRIPCSPAPSTTQAPVAPAATSTPPPRREPPGLAKKHGHDKHGESKDKAHGRGGDG